MLLLIMELLSPGGSVKSIKSALIAGADAVYVAGKSFGARAYAHNLEENELLDVIDYVHMNDKKLYLTVNTLLKNEEVEKQLYNYLENLYLRGLDAVIVQDLGVMNFISRNFPEMEIHASTQMNVTGSYFAKSLKKYNVSRVVVPREFSLEEIESLKKKTGMELEVFVHGAMCYCYSGQCLMSSLLGGRSANRGKCAQSCRLPYTVNDSKNPSYPLSLKDLCYIDFLPQLKRAGADSLKIEGRMKSPEYVAGTAEIYRKYIDLAEKGIDYKVDKKDRDFLTGLFSRSGFTTGYFTGDYKNMVSSEKSSGKTDKDVTEGILNKYPSDLLIKQPVDIDVYLYQYSNVTIEAKTVIKGREIIARKISDDEAQPAEKRPLDEKSIREKTGQINDTLFKAENINVYTDNQSFYSIKNLKDLRREVMDELYNNIISSFLREKRKPLFNKNEAVRDEKSPVIDISVATFNQLETVLNYDFVSSMAMDLDSFSADEIISVSEKKEKDIYVNLPRIIREKNSEKLVSIIKRFEDSPVKGYVVRCVEELGILNKIKTAKDIITDLSVYSANSETASYLKENNVKRMTFSLELNSFEIEELNKKSEIETELIVYGKMPLMVTALQNAACIKTGEGSLTDRKNYTFKVKYYENYGYSVIYNSTKNYLLNDFNIIEKKGPDALKLVFTDENEEETEEVMENLIKALSGEIYEKSLPSNCTRGHFNKKVD